jgi:hypothetical protein
VLEAKALCLMAFGIRQLQALYLICPVSRYTGRKVWVAADMLRQTSWSRSPGSGSKNKHADPCDMLLLHSTMKYRRLCVSHSFRVRTRSSRASVRPALSALGDDNHGQRTV